MKVYVLIAHYAYEGYGEPIGVYSTRKLAEEQLAKEEKNEYRRPEIMEYELDYK